MAKQLTKNGFHRKYRAVLEAFAARLGLGAHEYEVRSNKGGPAVLGEVVLHSDKLYVAVGSTTWDNASGKGDFLYRSCRGRQDYVGGRNYFLPIADLDGPHKRPAHVVAAFRGVMAQAEKL
jgi:hypothetical protein